MQNIELSERNNLKRKSSKMVEPKNDAKYFLN
jgi:hypothetical protein